MPHITGSKNTDRKLPTTRLRFDRDSSEIISTDAPIDYLIVGSGPAGSVLAHELRRGGKHVLLIERGSFIVPGSMQTRLIDDLLDSRTSDDGAIFIHNGMVVGGGSQVNVDLCFAPTLPAIQSKIESWRSDGRIGPDDFTREQLASAYHGSRLSLAHVRSRSLRSTPIITCYGMEPAVWGFIPNSMI